MERKPGMLSAEALHAIAKAMKALPFMRKQPKGYQARADLPLVEITSKAPAGSPPVPPST